MTDDEFVAAVSRNPAVHQILSRLPELGAPDAWLTAGCLSQSYWNLQLGRPPAEGVRDYDVFYFDEDLSWEAEDRVIKRAQVLFADIGALVEVRNQARVHLWFESRFGYPAPRLESACQGIDRFLFRGICLGIDKDFRVYAPYGFDDLVEGVLRPNPKDPRLDRMLEKAQDYRARWPHLRVRLD